MAVRTANVTNRQNGDEETFVDLSPRNAVIAAHAQDNGDWDSDSYESKYGSRVQRETTNRRIKWTLGHFSSYEKLKF